MELVSDLSPRYTTRMKPTYLQYFGFSSFHFTVFFAALLIATASFISFLNVLQLSAEMKVPRITTLGSIAIVENFKSGWNISVIKPPRKAMCLFYFFSVPNISIPILIERALVQPASVRRLDDFGLESFKQSLARRFDDLRKSSKAAMPASSCQMAGGVVSAIGVEVEVAQPHTSSIVAFVANVESFSRKSIEVKPYPTCGINRMAILTENGSSTVICATSPDFARPQTWSEGGAITINVLVESENGMYELGRHNDSHSFCLAASGRLMTDWMPRLSQNPAMKSS